MPVFEDRNPIAPRQMTQTLTRAGGRTLPDTLGGMAMRMAQQRARPNRLPDTQVAQANRMQQSAPRPQAGMGPFGNEFTSRMPGKPMYAPAPMPQYGGGAGEDLMGGLGAIGDVLRRGVATVNEFIPLGQPARGPAYNAFQQGGMFPQQQPQPYFQRPSWLDNYYRWASGGY